MTMSNILKLSGLAVMLTVLGGCASQGASQATQSLLGLAPDQGISRDLTRADHSCRRSLDIAAGEGLARNHPTFDRYRYCMRSAGYVLSASKARDPAGALRRETSRTASIAR